MGRLAMQLVMQAESAIMGGLTGSWNILPALTETALMRRCGMADVVVSQKQCNRCGEVKPIGEYQIINRSKTKPQGSPCPMCYPCRAEYSREWRAKKAEAPRKPITVIQKQCNACERTLPRDMFHRNRTSADGLTYSCRDCQSIQQKQWAEANPDKIRAKREHDREIMRAKRYQPKVEVETKTCRVCTVQKPSAEFHKNIYYPDGRTTICADCFNAYQATKRQQLNYEVSVSEKRCCICKHTKTADHFSRRTSLKDGLAANCKECQAEYTLRWRDENAEKIKADKSADYAQNAEAYRARARAWARTNVLRKSMVDREWRLRNIDRKRENDRAYREANREGLLENKRLWSRRYYIEVKKKDTGRMLHMRMSGSIRRGMTGKGGKSWQDLVPYTREQLLARLKKTMPKGYTWDDFMSGELHIDHIVPVSAFNFSSYTDIDFQRCWALTNLQLLPKKENLQKGRKISKPFQPTFSGI